MYGNERRTYPSCSVSPSRRTSVTSPGATSAQTPYAAPSPALTPSTATGPFGARPVTDVRGMLPAIVTAIGFALLFGEVFGLLARDWWQLPEAGHGLLLFPVALWLARKTGIREGAA